MYIYTYLYRWVLFEKPHGARRTARLPLVVGRATWRRVRPSVVVSFLGVQGFFCLVDIWRSIHTYMHIYIYVCMCIYICICDDDDEEEEENTHQRLSFTLWLEIYSCFSIDQQSCRYLCKWQKVGWSSLVVGTWGVADEKNIYCSDIWVNSQKW